MLRVVENKGALETARRVMQMSGQIFMYAIATGRAERNPVPDLRGALKTPVAKHYSFLKANDLPQFLKSLEAYDGSLQTKLALSLLLMTFVRTKELRGAEWTEIDWDKAEWRIPAERMKMKELHDQHAVVEAGHRCPAGIGKTLRQSSIHFPEPA